MNYADKATSLIGKQLMINAAVLTIAGLADKTGKLKNGDSAPYLNVTAADGTISAIHPRTASALFSKGEAEGIKLLVDAVATAVAIEAKLVPTETIHYPTVVAAPVVETVKKVSKKAQATAIFNEVLAAQGTRQDVIKRIIAETGSSLNLANTYYQNLRSGAWN